MVIQNNDLLTNPSELTEEMDFLPGELIVKLKNGMTAAEINALQEELDVSVIATTQTLGIQLWEINGMSVEEAIEILSDDPRFEYVEPNSIGSYTETFPNDLRFNELWGLNNTGQTGGTSDADIDAPEARELQTGNSELTEEMDFVPGELIVKPKTEMTAAEINALQEEMDFSVIATTQTLGIQLWEINGMSVEEAIEILS
ncbi:MAG: hypothetical protein QNJ65_10695, partial [Xenococcaceae cyanobacterium MO_234.B1]|nr:hypothetical protein [Xenococcaceae cyanobacterium MO_234.B1]